MKINFFYIFLGLAIVLALDAAPARAKVPVDPNSAYGGSDPTFGPVQDTTWGDGHVIT